VSKVQWGILGTANIGVKRVIPAIIAGERGVVAATAITRRYWMIRGSKRSTLTLMLLPRTPAIAFETIGRSNPLAATTYCLMVSAFNIANTYMLIVDGWGYSRRGVAGAYATDACVSVAACLPLGALLIALSRRRHA